MNFNNRIIENFDLTISKETVRRKIKDFIEAGMQFFDGFDKLEHIGSMYTVRTVLADREYDDARPTVVKHEGEAVYSLFSGKVDTCVDAANILIKKLKGI